MRLSILIFAACCGCALLGKNDPVVPRYFTPQDEAAPPTAQPHPELRLRLGRVTAWAHLRERLVRRTQADELTYDEDLRWSERPDVYLKAALARSLFEERGLVEALSGGGPTLDVELSAFEELAGRQVRMRALITLHDDRSGHLAETLTVDEPLAAGADRDVAVVEALSRALHRGVEQISDRVVAALLAPPAALAAPRAAK